MANRFLKWLKKRLTRKKKSADKKSKKLKKKKGKKSKNVCKGEIKPKETGASSQDMQGEHNTCVYCFHSKATANQLLLSSNVCFK